MINTPKFQLAKKLSLKSTHRCKIGAIIVKKKSIVGVGFNKEWKTHPLISKKNHYKALHAEVDACIGVDRRHLIGSTMYVYREDLNGNIALCKPCAICQEILKEIGIKKVYYTDPQEKESFGELKLYNK